MDYKKIIKKLKGFTPPEIIIFAAVFIISLIAVIQSFLSPYRFQIIDSQTPIQGNFQKTAAVSNIALDEYTVENQVLGVSETLIIGDNLNNRIRFEEGDRVFIRINGSPVSNALEHENLDIKLALNIFKDEVIERQESALISSSLGSYVFEINESEDYYIALTNLTNNLYYLKSLTLHIE